MMRPSISFLITVLLIFFFEQNKLCVHAQHNNSPTLGENNDDETETKICPHAPDFHYGIILAVSAFPAQTTVCSEQEENEISLFLQDRIDIEVNALPGTVKTKNKICGHPINHRRHLQFEIPQNHHHVRKHKRNSSLMANRTPAQNKRLLYGNRAYIYVGGGKCRYCLNDNFDHRTRALVLANERHSTRTRDEQSLAGRDKDGRDLMFVTVEKPKSPFPKVADILLCRRNRSMKLAFTGSLTHKFWYSDYIKWRNAKKTTFFDRENDETRKDLAGPYVAGDGFGLQVEMGEFFGFHHFLNQITYKDKETVSLPVKEAILDFELGVFDLPSDFTTDMLSDEPLYIFINGIKLDLNLLMSQPGTKTFKRVESTVKSGNSFAGIKWKVTQIHRYDKDFAFGPEPDKLYWIEITAPLILLVHKNYLDLDFMIKPNAKAKQYIFGKLSALLRAAKCNVTGLEDSPFDEFKSVVESRLLRKLGLDLAQEFQGREGHCLHDKIPVVSVHLEEKKGWNDSNPRCGR